MPTEPHDETSPRTVPAEGTSPSLACSAARRFWIGLVAGLLAGAIMWLAYWAVFPVFQQSGAAPKMFPTQQDIDTQRAARVHVEIYHAVLFLGLLGMVLGICLAVGEFFCRRSRQGAARGVTVTGLSGALFGCLAGILGPMLHAHLKWSVQTSPSTRAIVVHVLTLAVLGLGVGVGIGTIARQVRAAVRCSTYGLLAGLLAGFLFPLLTAVLLPPNNIDRIVPYEADVALFWFGLPSVLIGVLLINAFQDPATGKPEARNT